MTYMLNWTNKYFLQSAPIRISWAGFDSDTFRLQNNGWTLAIEDVFDHFLDIHQIRFILRHEMLDLYCFTEVNEITAEILSSNEKHRHLFFSIKVMGKNIHYTSIPQFNLSRIYEIDARPELIEMTPNNIKDLSIFKTLVKPDNSLIVEPDQISSLLEKIVQCQSPRQAEIRERMRKADARNEYKQTLHAQILSVAA